MGRQCAEAVKIRNLDPSKRINDRKEYHQPGDVKVVYQKNENEFMTNLKNKNNKETLQGRKGQTKDTEKIDRSKDKENDPTIVEFLKKMRLEGERKTKPCKKCDFEATSKEDLHEHMKSMHEVGLQTCDKCDFTSTSKTILQRHKTSLHEDMEYKCNQCDVKATTKRSFRDI